jgi:hypothetical protein
MAISAEGGVMPGVELKTSVCKGRVVVALRGDLDVTEADAAEAVIRPTGPHSRF